MKWLKRLFRWFLKSEVASEVSPTIEPTPTTVPKVDDVAEPDRLEDLPDYASEATPSEAPVRMAKPERKLAETARPRDEVARAAEPSRRQGRPVLVPEARAMTDDLPGEESARTEEPPVVESKAMLALVEREPSNGKAEEPVDPAEYEEEGFSELRTYVRRRVAAGFDLDGIESEALDLFMNDTDAETLAEVVPEVVSREGRRHEMLESSWIDATDCEKLDDAFRELENAGITARQNFSCCGTCGAGEIWEEMNVERSAGRAIRGYVFFDVQDTQYAADGYGLRLAYGSVEAGEEAALAVAREIIEVLARHGLSSNWKGDWSSRIGVPIEWKKRRLETEERAMVR